MVWFWRIGPRRHFDRFRNEIFSYLRKGEGAAMRKMSEESKVGLTLFVTGSLSIAWWIVVGIGQGSFPRAVLLASLSVGSFIVGCLVGFLFSSYGEESGTVGKIRDWLIGGLSALTIVKASSV